MKESTWFDVALAIVVMVVAAVATIVMLVRG